MFTFKFFYCACSHLFSHAHQAFVHFPKCTFSQLVLESNIWSGNFRPVSNFHGELRLQEQCNSELLFQKWTHPSYQLIKSIIFVGCVRIYCCKDFNVCPQAAISKNKSNKILKNTSPAVNKIMFVMRAAFLEWTICKVTNASVLKRGWVQNLLQGTEILFYGGQS